MYWKDIAALNLILTQTESKPSSNCGVAACILVWCKFIIWSPFSLIFGYVVGGVMTFNNSSLYLSQMHFPARAKTVKIFTDWRIFHSFAFSTLTVVTVVATLLTLRQPRLTLLTHLLVYGDMLHHHPDHPHHLHHLQEEQRQGAGSLGAGHRKMRWHKHINTTYNLVLEVIMFSFTMFQKSISSQCSQQDRQDRVSWCHDPH